MFAVKSRLVFKYKTHCLQERKSAGSLWNRGRPLSCRDCCRVDMPARSFSAATFAYRSFLQSLHWVPFPSNCFYQKNCPFQIMPEFCFNQVKNKNLHIILRFHVAINRQFGRDAPSNPIQCVQYTRALPVSHVMLILSETNPIICAVSEPCTEKHRSEFCWGACSVHSHGQVPGAPHLS